MSNSRRRPRPDRDWQTDPPPLRVVSEGRERRRRPAHARVPLAAWVAATILVLVGLWTVVAVAVVTVLLVFLAVAR